MKATRAESGFGYSIHFPSLQSKLYLTATFNSFLEGIKWEFDGVGYFSYGENKYLDTFIYVNTSKSLGLNELPLNLWYTLLQVVQKHFLPNFILNSDRHFANQETYETVENACYVLPQHFHPKIFSGMPAYETITIAQIGRWFTYQDEEMQIGGRYNYRKRKHHWLNVLVSEQLRYIGRLLFVTSATSSREKKGLTASYFNYFTEGKAINNSIMLHENRSHWNHSIDLYAKLYSDERTYNSLFFCSWIPSPSCNFGHNLQQDKLSDIFTFNEFLLLMAWKSYLAETNERLLDSAFDDPTLADDFSQSLANPIGRLRNEKFSATIYEYPRILEQLNASFIPPASFQVPATSEVSEISSTFTGVCVPLAVISLMKEYVTIDPPP